MKTLLKGLLAALVLVGCAQTQEQPPQAQEPRAVAKSLQAGGYVIIFRHGGTNRDQADTDPFNLDNVAKQRLLSEKGREVALQVGAAYQKLGIPLGEVYTSKFNRAVETGKLVSGRDVVATLDFTEGGLVVTPIENDRRAAAFRNMASTAPQPGANTIIVSHKPNILDAFGKDWFDVREGEASVFRPESGKYVLIGKLQATDWLELAKAR